MVHFHSVKYKNFLSTGNYWITIPLDQHAQTIIVGPNGSGKTTLLDALMFGLFGKAYRNINKPLLVNSINKRECIVQVEFTTNNKRYVVERGIKPNVFKISENGTWLDEDAHSMDFQDLLEQTILKFTEKAFKQVILLGAASFVPFMRLTTSERRSVIEDLLDIQVFSGMNSLLKERVGLTKDRLKDAQYAKALLEERERLHKDYQEKLKTNALVEESRRQERRTELTTALAYATQKLNETLQGRPAILAKLAPDAITKHTAASQKRDQIRKQLLSLEARLDGYRKEDACPTCEQPIEASVKARRCEETQQNIDLLTSQTAKLDDFIARQATRMADDAKHRDLLNAIDADVRQYQTAQSHLKTQLAGLDEPMLADPEKLKLPGVTHEEWLAVDAELEKTLYQQHIETLASTVLKDSGIKTRVVQHYLPIINHLINKHLGALDFPVHFTLDNTFKETIKSRHRDDFSYESFSEGEKKRIDLALLLTWRAVARLKNSTFTNILILDEVFDSALDATGTDDFIRLMQSLESDVNVFVISHKTDSIVDKFSNALYFAKTRGFSHFRVQPPVSTISDADSVR
jgi:DNA repair exonuclease SbcCD ATPase subunit